MKPMQHRISLGALALIVSLALPAGLLSLFSSVTTGEEIDAADTIVVARVASLQAVDHPQSTILTLDVEQKVLGAGSDHVMHLTVAGHPPLAVGDHVLALFDGGSLLGTYQMHKDPATLDYAVTSPVTGLGAQGIDHEAQNVPMPVLAAAIQARRGVSVDNGMIDDQGGDDTYAIVGPDAFEPNDDLASATPVVLDLPKPVTGMPTIITGLTIAPETDVDYFSFEGSGLALLHAETLDAGTADTPDTFMGVFDANSGSLLAFDDDSGDGSFSKIVVPLEMPGDFAVAVESAPDSLLDFDGDEGTTTGDYELSLELELGSYLWNSDDLIMGVSADGTFIEDLIGFKEVEGDDTLLVGVPADGWGVEYDATSPAGATHVFGGSGDQLTDPGFTSPLFPISFALGPFIDSNGFNRRGTGEAASVVSFSSSPAEGVGVTLTYEVPRSSPTASGTITLQKTGSSDITNLTFTRVLDVDLFGTGADTFHWTFDPASPIKAFPVDVASNVSNAIRPGASSGSQTDDLQSALSIDHGDGPQATYLTGFTYVRGHATEMDALMDAQRRLREIGLTTMVVAVDVDPDTGLYAAFGTGLGQ